MFSTNKGSQLQAYESWKGTNNIVNENIPHWSRYDSVDTDLKSNGFSRNIDNIDASCNIISTTVEYFDSGIWGKARPIKHWRKRLLLNKNLKISSSGLGVNVDYPGFSSATTSSLTDCSNNFYNYVDNNTPLNNGVIITDISKNTYGKCISCDPVSNLIKPATTVLNKKYYSNSKSYLYAKCKTYEQRNGGVEISGNIYFDQTGNPMYPSDNMNGSQMRFANGCGTRCKIVYKPNNQIYAVQGAVSSGTRIATLKNNAITKNKYQYSLEWGNQNMNVKDKLSHGCIQYYYRNGVKHICK